MGLEYFGTRVSDGKETTALLGHENFQVHFYLYNMCLKWIREFELPLKLQIDEATLDRWLVMMESNYLESNPYHNSTHAADVLAVSLSAP